MEFKKYQHIEKLGNTEVEDLLDAGSGLCYVYPKLDGTNACVWRSSFAPYVIKAGSRNRELSETADNAGFCAFVKSNEKEFHEFFSQYPNYILYGEWLVPHTLKTYRDDAWRKFYVFDVYDSTTDTYLDFASYNLLLQCYCPTTLVVIPPLIAHEHPTEKDLIADMRANTYLIKDGEGVGEGIVVKNYAFRNRYGRVTWAKMVLNEFKEKHKANKDIQISKGKQGIETRIVNEYLTSALVEKEYARIKLETPVEDKSFIPKLFGVLYYTLIREHSWDFIKKYKNPVLDYKELYRHVILKIKDIKKELF